MAKLTKNAIKLYKTHIVDLAPGQSYPWVPSTGHPGRAQTEISAFSIQSAIKRGHFTEAWIGEVGAGGHTEYTITDEGRAFGEKRIPSALLAQYRREAGQDIEESKENAIQDEEATIEAKRAKVRAEQVAEVKEEIAQFPLVIVNPKSKAKYTRQTLTAGIEGELACKYKDTRGRMKAFTISKALAWDSV